VRFVELAPCYALDLDFAFALAGLFAMLSKIIRQLARTVMLQ
jgi:hypothetical protein